MAWADMLNALLSGAERHVRKVLVVQGHPVLIPTFHLVTADDEVVIDCPWNNATEKRSMLKQVRKEAERLGAIAGVFMAEGWAVRRGVMPLAQVLATNPTNSPDRVEVVDLVASDGEHQVGRMFEMVRDRAGRLTELRRLHDVGGTRMLQGDFIPRPGGRQCPRMAH